MARNAPTRVSVHFDPEPVRGWLGRDGYLIADDKTFLTEFALQICDAGLPLDRMSVGIPVIHPQIMGHSYVWLKDGEFIDRTFPATAESMRLRADSPIQAAYQDGKNTHYHIPPEPVEGEFGIYVDLRTEGFTSHATFAVKFSDSSFKTVTIATRRPGGFQDTEIDAFCTLIAPLAPLLEVRTLKMMSRTLLEIYIGPTAGNRVLNGEIHRGEGEVIQSVIWFSDLRNSTQLSTELDGQQMVGHLNEFFSIVTNAVDEQGGEVLKFIGDSVLAIFPCESIEEVGCEASHMAETAAQNAIERTAAYNAKAAKNGRLPIDFGIALHVGEVFYGNVGGEARLDFTVIGPAVNLAARIEGATKETQHPVLVSEYFAHISKASFNQVGTFRFHGVDGWTKVFAPDEIPAPVQAPIGASQTA